MVESRGIIIGSRARFCGRLNMNAGDDENVLNDADANEDLIDTVKRQKRLGKTQLTKLYIRFIKLMTEETIDGNAILTALENTEEKKMETIQIVGDLVVLYEEKGYKRNPERSEGDEIEKLIEYVMDRMEIGHARSLKP